jgi:hypothetical protein
MQAMFVTTVHCDDRIDKECVGAPFEQLAWEQIESLIRALNGQTRTSVTLSSDKDAHLSIFGGADNCYVVHVTFDNLTFRELMGDSNGEPVTFLHAGQEVEVPSHRCVDLERVIRAARVFAERGRLDRAAPWSAPR